MTWTPDFNVVFGEKLFQRYPCLLANNDLPHLNLPLFEQLRGDNYLANRPTVDHRTDFDHLDYAAVSSRVAQ